MNIIIIATIILVAGGAYAALALFYEQKEERLERLLENANERTNFYRNEAEAMRDKVCELEKKLSIMHANNKNGEALQGRQATEIKALESQVLNLRGALARVKIDALLCKMSKTRKKIYMELPVEFSRNEAREIAEANYYSERSMTEFLSSALFKRTSIGHYRKVLP